METLKIKQSDGSEKTVILPVRGMVGTLCTGSDLYTICCNVVLSNKKVGIVRIIGITEDKYGKYTIKDVDLATDSRWIEVSLNEEIPIPSA